jgi:hypothetical protein
MRSDLRAYLFIACAIAGSACSGGEKTQVLIGRLSTPNAVAVRAVDGTTVVTAARVRSDGTFTLLLPAHHHYRLEVLSSSGVHNLIGAKDGGYADVTFRVCQPQDPFDMGGMCDPNDPNSCKPEGAPVCDPVTDPSCSWCNDPSDPNCGGDTAGCMDPIEPSDPSCNPPPCDPLTDPSCEPPCMDPNDPACDPPPPCDPLVNPMCAEPCTDPADPSCTPPTPCDPATEPNCDVACDPTVDAMCTTPPPPCMDPIDADTCTDPCTVDPLACGCSMTDLTDPSTPTMTPDANTCWPPPEPCTMGECPEEPWWPEHPPGDFGCGDGNTGEPEAMPMDKP